jgi:hypothetical protein
MPIDRGLTLFEYAMRSHSGSTSPQTAPTSAPALHRQRAVPYVREPLGISRTRAESRSCLTDTERLCGTPSPDSFAANRCSRHVPVSSFVPIDRKPSHYQRKSSYRSSMAAAAPPRLAQAHRPYAEDLPSVRIGDSLHRPFSSSAGPQKRLPGDLDKLLCILVCNREAFSASTPPFLCVAFQPPLQPTGRV